MVGDEQLSPHYSTKSVLTKNGAINDNTSFGAFAGSGDNEQHIARYVPRRYLARWSSQSRDTSPVDTWRAGLLSQRVAGPSCGWVKIKTQPCRQANRERYKMFEKDRRSPAS